ncbi:hypothetical protein [Dactylosporangium sp. CA-092794]|uniref:hypothetical protein n=1 Tax=Dactylosporangium sp. CA-092794 TaxID=3239929 RepID=UPI003D943F7C
MAVFSARTLAVPLAAAAVLAMAACGSQAPAAPVPSAPAGGEIQLVDAPAKTAGLTGDGRGDASAAPAASSAPATGAAEPAAKWVQLSANTAAIGATVTDVRGFTLYRFAKDSPDPATTKCTGVCAQSWPPVLIRPGGRVFVDGLDAAKVGAVRRPDGGVQVTIAGWPAYRSADDTVPGDVNGQGVDDAWFAFTPAGEANPALIAAVAAEPAAADSTEALTAKQTGDGAIIVDDEGATLYVSAQDGTDPPASKCADACAALWRPVIAKTGGKVKLNGIDEQRVWWLSRKDGTKQVALDGAPLYRNAADKSTDTVIASAAQQGWSPAR